MLKNLIFLLFLSFCVNESVKAQSMKPDSLRMLAQKDAQRFKLNKTDLKIFRKDKKNSMSDFFKPTPAYASKVGALNDSVYVKEFRDIAYRKTKRRRTAAHYLLIGGVTYAVVAAIITIPIAATH